ncbi:MAG: PAS domain S-box protein [Desulfococcaceae bacterium]
MKLRLILFVLSFLAFLSTSAGGWLYYHSLKKAALTEAEQQADIRVKNIRKHLAFVLSQNAGPVRLMSGLREIREAVTSPLPEILSEANAVLDHFRQTLDADICYLINDKGYTVASSNRNDPDSFVGKIYSFRPYFQKSIRGEAFVYMALGVTSDRRGAYYSYPVYDETGSIPAGVAVIKISIDLIEREFALSSDEIVLVTDPMDIIFISSRGEWICQSLRELSPEEKDMISQSMQFGEGPWNQIDLTIKDGMHAADGQGNRYVIRRTELDEHPGWQIIYLQNIHSISKKISDPMSRITGEIILVVCILIGLSLFVLYRKASREILRRRAAEKSLRESEERYRSIYHNAPAMLHSVNRETCLISVSDNWLKTMGYERSEVTGRSLKDFMTEDSVIYLENHVIPEFYEKGCINDVPYCFVKKNGETIDVLLSAFGERDGEGNIIRSLSVSIDITERLRAEDALKKAKEELSRYSGELEMEVQKRTEVIAGILRFTPNVVYIKNREGRYLLINSRYEELFGVTSGEVCGKKDDEIHPESIARQLQQHDADVIAEGLSFRTEEHIVQEDGIHTYLSVKFPIYDQTGKARGIGGIATDITELKNAQEQLRRLSGSIIAGQEKERAAIARELHDELGQILTALHMDAVWLSKYLKEKDAKAAQRALSMCELTDKTIEEVRRMAVQLRPGVLDNLGLVDALEWFAGEFEKRTEITCLFEHSQIPALSDSIATSAYRIAQECLTNVARHAGANRVNITLHAENDILTLTVADNGSGFDTSKLGEVKGLGVAGMKERAMLVRGTVEVRSVKGQGTKVCFRMKINE